MKLLIDADFIVYKCCAAAETEIDWSEDVVLVTSRFSEAYKAVLHEIIKVMDVFGIMLNLYYSFPISIILGKKFTRNTKGIEIGRSPVDIRKSSLCYMMTTK